MAPILLIFCKLIERTIFVYFQEMNLLPLPEYTSSLLLKYLPPWNMCCLLCSVMDCCAVVELYMVGLRVGVYLVGILVIAACWAWVAARLNFVNTSIALQSCHSSKLLINIQGFIKYNQSTQSLRCLVQCMRRDLLVH